MSERIAFYATRNGGRRAVGVGSGFVSLTGSSEQDFAAIVNPSGSGVDVVLDVGEFSSSADTQFRRYSVVSTGITNASNPETVRNLGGGSNTSPVTFYKKGNYTAAGGSLSKVAFVKGFETYFTYLRGRSILRPGRALYWTIDGTGQNFTGAVYLEWWEQPAS